jgi:hypothetical protein
MSHTEMCRYRPEGFYEADSGVGFAYAAWVRLRDFTDVDRGFTYFGAFEYRRKKALEAQSDEEQNHAAE